MNLMQNKNLILWIEALFAVLSVWVLLMVEAYPDHSMFLLRLYVLVLICITIVLVGVVRYFQGQHSAVDIDRICEMVRQVETPAFIWSDDLSTLYTNEAMDELLGIDEREDPGDTAVLLGNFFHSIGISPHDAAEELSEDIYESAIECRNGARRTISWTTSLLKKTPQASLYFSIGFETTELEDAKFNYDTAQSNLVSAESDVNNTIITAPMDGVVVGIPQTVGSMAVQGNNSPTVIMRIADLSSKQILAKVDETDIGSVKVGQEATFTVDSYSGKTFRARVSKISQTDTGNTWNINSSSSTSSTSANSSASVIYYYVTLDVEDPENLLLPAMTARVDITTASRSEVLSVPLSTLKTDSNGSYVVLVQPDGTQENRYVETGIYDDEYVEILSGLEEGDMISSSYTAKKSSSSGSSKNDRGGPPPHM